MRTIVIILALAAMCSIVIAAEKDTGLVLHYTFEKITDSTLQDKSGHGNDGTIKGKVDWKKEKSYSALRFNGKDTRIECPPSPSLELSDAGSLEIWCRPESMAGGLLSWHTGASAAERRLALTFIKHWYYGTGLTGFAGNGTEVWGGMREPWKFSLLLLEPGPWYHFVLSFDGNRMRLYQNGRQITSTPQEVSLVVKDVPLRIGVAEGPGAGAFRGDIGEVRIYNRALAPQEIAAHYRSSAQAMGHQKILQLTPRLYATRGELEVEADLLSFAPLPEAAKVKMELRDTNKRLVQQAEREVAQGAESVGVPFDTHALQGGAYEISAVLLGRDGAQIGETAVEKWEFPARAQRAEAKPGVKILNNLVTELVNLDSVPAKPAYREVSFTNPREGWVFVSSTSRLDRYGQIMEAWGDTVHISIDGAGKEDAVIVHRPGDPSTKEVMRFLTAGDHKLRIWFPEKPGAEDLDIRKLIVRSVPELLYCAHPSLSRGYGGVYDFAFLAKDVLPNINVIVGDGDPDSLDLHKQWKERGGKWYLEKNIPSLISSLKDVPKPMTADYAYDFWVNSFGFTNPYLDGIFPDEFCWTDENPDYPAYIEAIKRIAANEEFKDKAIQCWFGGEVYADRLGLELMKTAIAAGYKIGWEAYFPEMPTEAIAQEFLYGEVRQTMENLEKALPGITAHTIMVLGFQSAPPHTINTDPHVDFKVWMDMQFNYLVNAPECLGLYGVMVYKARYANEEIIRWAGRLFRHYCIEGKRNLLSDELGFKYLPGHIANADFDDGLKGWTVSAAAPGSVKAESMPELSLLFGRYIAPHSGKNHLLTKRSADKPNQVSQEIKGLVPGKLYSAKLFVADYQDYVKGESVRKRLAVSLDIENVNMIPVKCMILDVDGQVRAGAFAGKKPPWMNVHRLVFRALDTTAKLTISDWADATTPGGPIGQEILYNFVEVQPYIED